MYELLRPPTVSRSGGLAIPQFRRVRDGLMMGIQRIQDHHRNNPKYLAAQHFLVRLLGSLNISHQLDDNIFVDRVSDYCLEQAMSMRIPSTIYRGKITSPGLFYGANVDEVLIAHTDSFDVSKAVEDWANLQPLKVLAHPYCDFDLAIPNGKGHSQGSGVAVIAIDIPKLALQYKCWRRWERGVNKDSPQSVMQFLLAFPIPNMLQSQTNIAILNRVMLNYFGGQPPIGRAAHSFYVTNWAKEIDAICQYYLAFIEKRSFTFNDIIEVMPALGPDGMHEALKLPEETFSNNIQWAVVMARLLPTAWLVRMNSDYGNQNNGRSLNYLYRYLNYIEINQGLRIALPEKHFNEVKYIIDEGIRPYL